MSGEWLSLIELTAVFGLVMGLAFWQLRSLDKLDEEDAKKEREQKDRDNPL